MGTGRRGGRFVAISLSIVVHAAILAPLVFNPLHEGSYPGRQPQERIEYISLPSPTDASVDSREPLSEDGMKKSDRTEPSQPEIAPPPSLSPLLDVSAMKDIADKVFSDSSLNPNAVSPKKGMKRFAKDFVGPFRAGDSLSSLFEPGITRVEAEISNRDELVKEIERRYFHLATPRDTIRVILEFVLDENGVIVRSRVKTSSGNGMFDNLALRVLNERAKFTPRLIGSRKVKSVVEVPVSFSQKP